MSDSGVLGGGWVEVTRKGIDDGAMSVMIQNAESDGRDESDESSERKKSGR
jgi:hypothetical protein